MLTESHLPVQDQVHNPFTWIPLLDAYNHTQADKQNGILQKAFSNSSIFCMKNILFDLNFTEICFQTSDQVKANTGSDNDLGPNRRDSSIGTKGGSVYWDMYASDGRDVPFTWCYICWWCPHSRTALLMLIIHNISVRPGWRNSIAPNVKAEYDVNMSMTTICAV